MGSFTDSGSNTHSSHRGALVVSLDFELHWGVRDHMPAHGSYRNNLIGARIVIPRILQLFERYRIAATWATVGFLFAASRDELDQFHPATLPVYADSRLDPYLEPIGVSEQDDPLHYAASLIEQIRQCPNQEIATHTFSHFCCLEPGQTPEAFAADLDSAIAIAKKRGIALRSIVFPRNQVNLGYTRILLEKGITSYRGCERGWMHRPIAQRQRTASLRAARLVDSYVRLSRPQVVPWSHLPEPSGLCNVRASRFLAPVRRALKPFEQLRLLRIKSEMESAAKQRGIFHLWFHPHNLGVNVEENLYFLEAVLQCFSLLRDRHGMSSLSMSEAAEHGRNELVPAIETRLKVRVEAAAAKTSA
jgi:peptidoglycan/xylan/chitin deacetylase (PgdA/CDA1 family)